MATMSISGIVSGIDWSSMVTELIEQATEPAYAYVDKRDRLELKKDLFEEFLVSLQGLQSTLAPLKLASTFKAKEVEISRLDSSGSYKGVLTASVNADADINVYDLEVLQLAKSQINRSKQTAASLSDLGISSSNSYFYVSAGGQKVRIDADPSDTLTTLADKINTTLKTQSPAVQVTATVVDNRLVLKSDSTGLGTTEAAQDLTRAASGTDTLNFTVNPDNGTVTIKSGSTVYQMGADFDIVNGNQVRWRESGMLNYAPAGGTYDFTYRMTAGETYTAKGTRAASGNTDKGVVPSSLTGADAANYKIKIGNIIYDEGDDFTIVGNDIMWRTGVAPDNGVEYELVYTAAGGETVALQNVSGALDSLTGVSLSSFDGGTATITAGGVTYTQGIDFDIVADPGTPGDAAVRWRAESGYIAPGPGASYDVIYEDGTPAASGIVRSSSDTIDLADYGLGATSFTGVLGALSYNGDVFATSSFGTLPDGSFLIDWTYTTAAASPSHPAVPASGASYTVTYTYDTNVFTLSDDDNGFLAALELDLTDDFHYTAAQDAVMILDGEQITRSSNQIGESTGNELIKGMTIELKGAGSVFLDVSQDAEAAVTALQSFLDEYNAVLDWINVRIVEEELTAGEKAALTSSDEYQLKWGLLRGNSLLRDSKNTLRRMTSALYVVSAASKTSRNAVYGTMSQNGVKNAGSFSVSVGSVTVDIPVDPSDTLQSIADKINALSIGGRPNPLRIGSDGSALASPLARASVSGGKLTIEGVSGSVTLGGSSDILKTLQLDQQYTSLSQIGIKLPSTGEMSTDGLSGTLELDTSVFMTALEANAGDVASVVTTFAAQMQTYLDNMIASSQKEVATGVTTAKGAVVREMNAIDTEIASIDKYLEEFQRRLDDKQAALEKQFAAAETSLASLVQQAEWLSSTVAQLTSSSS